MISKQLGRFVSLNHNIYIASDHTLMEADHIAHAAGPIIFSESRRSIYFNNLLLII